MRQYFFVLEPKLLETARKCLVVFYGKILEKINPSLRKYYVSFFEQNDWEYVQKIKVVLVLTQPCADSCVII